LLHQFLSPLYNKREDEYGGSFENRLRFAREVIAEVRRRAGDDWVVGVRISLSDFIPGALDIGDAVAVTETLESDGQIDYVNVTAAGYHNIFRAIEPSDEPDGYLVDLSAQVKGATALPVFAVGGIKDAQLAEEILASAKADMVAMTRAQIADPSSRTRCARDVRMRSTTASAVTRAASPGSSRGCRSPARSIRRPVGSAASACSRLRRCRGSGSWSAADRPG
jgi:2,4-dienoyl-CoA reductase-like NADH-dependent reductase (Old Yellow Enzyme family)